jgi:hypothetical protein
MVKKVVRKMSPKRRACRTCGWRGKTSKKSNKSNKSNKVGSKKTRRRRSSRSKSKKGGAVRMSGEYFGKPSGRYTVGNKNSNKCVSFPNTNC